MRRIEPMIMGRREARQARVAFRSNSQMSIITDRTAGRKAGSNWTTKLSHQAEVIAAIIEPLTVWSVLCWATCQHRLAPLRPCLAHLLITHLKFITQIESIIGQKWRAEKETKEWIEWASGNRSNATLFTHSFGELFTELAIQWRSRLDAVRFCDAAAEEFANCQYTSRASASRHGKWRDQ